MTNGLDNWKISFNTCLLVRIKEHVLVGQDRCSGAAVHIDPAFCRRNARPGTQRI